MLNCDSTGVGVEKVHAVDKITLRKSALSYIKYGCEDSTGSNSDCDDSFWEDLSFLSEYLYMWGEVVRRLSNFSQKEESLFTQYVHFKAWTGSVIRVMLILD